MYGKYLLTERLVSNHSHNVVSQVFFLFRPRRLLSVAVVENHTFNSRLKYRWYAPYALPHMQQL